MKDYSAYDFYAILGVSRSADFQEIKRAYYRNARACHPDLHGGSKQKEEEFKTIVLAFDVLSDPYKRSIYEKQRFRDEKKENLPGFEPSEFSVMDSDADDTLEELIVGNEVPEDTTLATLFLDLEKTEIFMKFREAKNLYLQKRYYDALILLKSITTVAPQNILYHYYLARVYAALGKYYLSEREYLRGIEIGQRRVPPQRLKRFHDELREVRKKRSPIWEKLISIIFPKRDEKLFVDEQAEMIAEMNRAIGNINRELREREERREKEKRLLE